MTTVEALRALYTAMGGTATDVANLSLIPELINKIAALYTSGAVAPVPEPKNADEGKILVAASKSYVLVKKEFLPAVTATNNGKILKVVDGEWALADDATAAPASQD